MSKQKAIFRNKIKVNDDMILEGYVVKWDSLSCKIGGMYEKVRKGAFSKSLKENDIKALYQHDETKVLASTTSKSLELIEDEVGLRYKVKLNNTTWAKDCYECAEDLDGVSFGFYLRKYTDTPKGDFFIRELIDVDLFEISFVTYPAYESSEINKRNERNDYMHEKLIEQYRKRINQLRSEYKPLRNFDFTFNNKLNEYDDIELKVRKALSKNDTSILDEEMLNLEKKLNEIEEITSDNKIENGMREQRNKEDEMELDRIITRDVSKEKSPVIRINDCKSNVEFRKAFTEDNDNSNMSISDFAKGILFNDWGRNEALVRNRVDGSVIMPTKIVSDIIYTARQQSVLLGKCPVLPMKEGKVLIGKVKEDVELDFKEKYERGKETTLGLEGVELNAKTLYAFVEIAEEDLQDLKNLDSILRSAFAGAVAKALDENFLYTNSESVSKPGVYPFGILDNEKIKKIEVDTVDYDMIARAKLEIAKVNGKPDVVGFNPAVNYILQTKKDSTGQYINPPSFYNDLSKIESNGLKTKDVIVFDSSQILVGIRQNMNIKVMNSLETGTVILRCMVRADVVPIREDHICKITIQE